MWKVEFETTFSELFDKPLEIVFMDLEKKEVILERSGAYTWVNSSKRDLQISNVWMRLSTGKLVGPLFPVNTFLRPRDTLTIVS